MQMFANITETFKIGGQKVLIVLGELNERPV